MNNATRNEQIVDADRQERREFMSVEPPAANIVHICVEVGRTRPGVERYSSDRYSVRLELPVPPSAVDDIRTVTRQLFDEARRLVDEQFELHSAADDCRAGSGTSR